jgi:hypothetical protein
MIEAISGPSLLLRGVALRVIVRDMIMTGIVRMPLLHVLVDAAKEGTLEATYGTTVESSLGRTEGRTSGRGKSLGLAGWGRLP